jgi:hypothetical protein
VDSRDTTSSCASSAAIPSYTSPRPTSVSGPNSRSLAQLVKGLLNVVLDPGIFLAERYIAVLAGSHHLRRTRQSKRESQSIVIQEIAPIIESCQFSMNAAMNAAIYLAEKGTKLCAANQRQKRTPRQKRQYLLRRRALQAPQGQALVAEAQRGAEQGGHQEGSGRPARAPPTCSKCHVQGHNRRQCNPSSLASIEFSWLLNVWLWSKKS